MSNIASKLKQIHNEIYGTGKPSCIFSGGNVGLALLGESIERASENIADAIRETKQEASEEDVPTN